MNSSLIRGFAAVLAVILVSALVAVPFQDQVANAAPPTKKYQVYVTLTNVPVNALDLSVNATIIRSPFIAVSNTPVETVTSPTSGDTVKFVLSVEAGSNETHVFVCGNTLDFSVSDCTLYPLPSKKNGPIRLEFLYPT